MPLARYAVDPVTGFVPRTPPLRRLPSAFDAWETLVPEVSAMIRSRGFRSAVQLLPQLDVSQLQSDVERERAMLLLCHFANVWVWGDAEPDLRLPPQVAVPLCALSDTLGRPPIAHYASMTLGNWQLVDANAPLSVDNARTLVQFLGGVDEDWFFIASMGVELAGAPLLPVTDAAVTAARSGSDAELTSLLEQFAHGMTPVHTALHRIREWSDPHTYYTRVRPYITGWPAPGVIYEGVSETPRRLLGGSAAQSSLIQLFDALFGLAHPDSPSGAYLRAVREYMPPLHRAFVVDTERDSRVRQRAISGTPMLRNAYNAALEEIISFRNAHMQLAHDFIVGPSGAPANAKGTGGTSLASFLIGARDTTMAAQL
jgi:indoleamine 2,3-dioxygenase